MSYCVSHANGVVEVLDAGEYRARTRARWGELWLDRVTTCGTCGRMWDDGIVTGVTPAPSGRCPFEYEHADDPAADDVVMVRRDHLLAILDAHVGVPRRDIAGLGDAYLALAQAVAR